MAKKQQELKTTIVLSGRVDNTFGAIGEGLMVLGSQLNTISGRIIDLGTDSIELYRDYDDIMREVKALGEYDEKTIEALNQYNRTVAQTSRFTMEQAASAEVLMAQLGLNIDQTRALMPTVMELATAARIDLADSLDYLYYTLNALGEPMSYAQTLADQMAKTAALSAADIDTLGLSMQRLGSGAQLFTGGSSEILAILGGIAQFGSDMQGQEAGTQLRNFMLTLMAPAKSKDEIIRSLKITEDEWGEFESYMDDAGINVADTAAAMQQLGLSVYDSATGQLKPAIQIIAELKAGLDGLEGTDERNKALANLFGKRTTITAKNLIAALGQIIEYQQEIESGSTGYTNSMAETMEGGIGGTLRELSASWNALKVTLGEHIAPTVGKIADGLNYVVDGIANLDESALSALVGGLSGLAAAGPGLLIVGGVFRLIGSLGTPLGAAATAIAALAAGVYALGAANDQSFKNTFGEMVLDADTLSRHISGLDDNFKGVYGSVRDYAKAVEEAVKTYKSASGELSSELLTFVVTGQELSESDREKLLSLGDQMKQAVIDGVTHSTARSMTYWEMLFGGEGTAENNTAYSNLIDIENEQFGETIKEAEEIGTKIKNALTDAFEGGISPEEYELIKGYFDQYNTALARASAASQREEDQVQALMLLNKAQGVSWESLDEYARQLETQRDENRQLADEEFLYNYSKAELNGASKQDLDEAKSKYEAQVMADNAMYDQYLLTLWNSGAKDSDFSDAYRDLADTAQGYLTGEVSSKDAQSQYNWEHSQLTGERRNLNQYMSRIISGLGGYDALEEKIKYYEKNAPELSNMLLQLYAMDQIANGFTKINYAENVPGNQLMDNLLGFIIPYTNHDSFTQFAEAHSSAQHALKPAEQVEQALFSGSIDVSPTGKEAAGDFAQDFQSVLNVMPPSLSVSKPSGWTDGAAYARDYQAGINANRPSVSVKNAPSGEDLDGYALGGRATMPSIFGEAGPEWAIPEAHTERTARLLDMARASSGFTWPELISRSGAVHGRAGGAQIIYSPTIYARDASGVEQTLMDDKERLDRWFKERQMREEMEEYV